MNATSPVADTASAFELRFDSLFQPGRGYAFPCDAAGRVDLLALHERVRCSYLQARERVGRDLAAPSLVARTLH